MGLLSKVKGMFIYEDEDEKDEIKKEIIQVKIPTPERVKDDIEEDNNDLEMEKTKEIPIEKEKQSIEVKKSNDIGRFDPNYFDDNDFNTVEEKKVEPEIVKQEYKYTRTETTIKPTGTAYSGRKENQKSSFTPTPIISPVYGVLDKNYKKEEITSKKRPTKIYSQFDKIDVDDIRNKAFGTYEDDDAGLSIRERDTIVFNDDIDIKFDSDVEITDYEEQSLDIFKELEKKDALDELLDNYSLGSSYEDNEDDTKTLVEEELNRDYDNYERELENSYKEDLNDSDLFNLIDSMYNNEDGE